MSSSLIGRREFLGAPIAAGTLLAGNQLSARGLDSYPAPDRELLAPVNGGRVYIRVNGRLDGPRFPIVMIHGAPGSSHASFLNLLAHSD